MDAFSGCHCTSVPPKLVVTPAPNHSTLQWHPAMALPQSWPSPSPPTITHYNGTLRWHPVRAPRHHDHSPQSWSSPSPLPPTIAHYTGTTSPAMAPRPLPQTWSSTLPPHYNGNVQWHPTMAPRPLHPAMAPCTSNPPKWFVALPPYWK